MKITAENAGAIVSELSALVSQATEAVDQSPENLNVIATILLKISRLIKTGNLSTEVNVRKCNYVSSKYFVAVVPFVALFNLCTYIYCELHCNSNVNVLGFLQLVYIHCITHNCKYACVSCLIYWSQSMQPVYDTYYSEVAKKGGFQQCP